MKPSYCMAGAISGTLAVYDRYRWTYSALKFESRVNAYVQLVMHPDKPRLCSSETVDVTTDSTQQILQYTQKWETGIRSWVVLHFNQSVTFLVLGTQQGGQQTTIENHWFT